MQVYPHEKRSNVAPHSYILAKKSAKLCLDQAYRLQAYALRLLKVVDFPVPTFTQMLGVGSHSIRHYYESGINCILPITVAGLHAGVELRSDIRILDFGCGTGRQLLHITKRFPKPSYYACDVNEPAVQFIKRNFPQVQIERNNFHPPLPFADAYFDMIYSVSVFSHLGPEDQESWLRELARVTRPGGHCFLTTEGATAIEQMRAQEMPEDVDARQAALAARGLIFREYADRRIQKDNEKYVPFGSKYRGIDGTYGTTAMSREYIANHWTRFGFAVETIVEGIIDYRQDLVVLRRS